MNRIQFRFWSKESQGELTFYSKERQTGLQPPSSRHLISMTHNESLPRQTTRGTLFGARSFGAAMGKNRSPLYSFSKKWIFATRNVLPVPGIFDMLAIFWVPGPNVFVAVNFESGISRRSERMLFPRTRSGEHEILLCCVVLVFSADYVRMASHPITTRIMRMLSHAFTIMHYPPSSR